ncbi:glycosyl hydrolase family 71-domain-containing protein [Aspergillus filifer]
MKLLSVASVLAVSGHASAAAVFAHFMVGNANNYSLSDWQTDINLAVDAKLDAFALNIAYGDDSVPSSVALAFEAAQDYDFSLFFSFDYAGGTSAWPKADVISYGNQYFSNSAYYKYNGQPFVSTFEGPGYAADWIEIKETTGCFFIPDWSSLGAKEALEAGGGDVVDGLFNWAAWPWGTRNIDTYTDGSYYNFMGKNISSPDPGNGMPYMMAVSPWFYTNLPGYHKNWCWKGDDLWYERWMEVIYTLPEFVEIISWNDYGESHYIGPLYEDAYEAPMTIGKAPINYVQGMPHDGWRKFLPWVVDYYKNGISTITQEGLVGWYRTSPGRACGTGDTTGNTASQLQIEFQPYELMEDKVFFTALLASDATVTVSIGGASQTGSWTWKPDGGIGLYHGSVPFNGDGDVVITLSRGGSTIAQISGGPVISGSCNGQLTNWNAWVGEADGPSVDATPTLARSDQACIQGTGVDNFGGICSFACQYGYCPISACVCQAVGAPVEGPAATHPVGYPLAGLDASYSGICAFDCLRGYCPDTACSTVSAPLTVPTVSDFDPPACIAGQVQPGVTDGLSGLCSFACNYGFCPIHACECTAQGALVDSNSLYVDVVGKPIDGLEDWGLCAWSCQHGYCPPGVCNSGTGSDSGGGSGGDGSGDGLGDGSGLVYVDPSVWTDPEPTIGCEPPCTLIFPPVSLATPVTVTWPDYVTGIYSSSGSETLTVSTTINLEPFTVSAIPFWPVTIETNDASTGIITPIQSIMPPFATFSLPSDQATISVGIGVDASGATESPRNYTAAAPTWGGGYATLQPQPSITIPIPATDFSTITTTVSGTTTTKTSSTHPVSFTRTSTGTQPTCTSDCGTQGCLFGCGGKHPCGLFGCDGGCGIFGCGGGGCGLGGCGGGDWENNDCGPGGCGCEFGCAAGGDNGNGGSHDCKGPDCHGSDDDGGGDDDDDCEEKKTVTSCGVLCTETVAFTSTYSGECSTTTCETTSCGVDTTRTETTTTTIENFVTLTAVATDTIWTVDATDAYVADVWTEFSMWSSAEDEAASSTTSTTTTTTTTAETSGPTWTIGIYSGEKCTGDFYELEGHNWSSVDDECLVIRDMPALVTDTSTYCVWESGTIVTTCDKGTFTHALSWWLNPPGAVCTVYDNDSCSDDDGTAQAYIANGCQTYSESNFDQKKWVAVKCGYE